ncbi:TPA: AfaD family invasin [Escherichia coli]
MIEMNKKNVYMFPVAMTLMVMSGFSLAAELNLNSLGGMSGELRDGAIVATGRIVCQEAHTRLHVWMNAREDEGRPGHYLVRGKRDSRNEIRIRLEGKEWVPVPAGQRGVERTGTDTQVMFDVVADGRQHVDPDEYIFSVTGTCNNND